MFKKSKINIDSDLARLRQIHEDHIRLIGLMEYHLAEIKELISKFKVKEFGWSNDFNGFKVGFEKIPAGFYLECDKLDWVAKPRCTISYPSYVEQEQLEYVDVKI